LEGAAREVTAGAKEGRGAGGAPQAGGIGAGRNGAGRKARRVSPPEAKAERKVERAGVMAKSASGGFDTDWFDPRFD
jgi:hypothetical protein